MTKLSKKKVKEAIKGSKGIITAVANRCEVQRKYIHKYINKYPDIKEALQEEREKLEKLLRKSSNKEGARKVITLSKDKDTILRKLIRT